MAIEVYTNMEYDPDFDEYTYEGSYEFDLKHDSWQGGKDRMRDLTDDLRDQLEEFIEANKYDLFGDEEDDRTGKGVNENGEVYETTLNDYLWFEDDHYAEVLGFKDAEELWDYCRDAKAGLIDNVNTTKKLTINEADDYAKDDVRELMLFITNDGDLYRSMTTPIIKNMKRKIKAGKYDPEMAVKGWQYLADEGVRKYDKMYGSGRGSLTLLPKSARVELARQLRDYYDDEVNYEEANESVSMKESAGRSIDIPEENIHVDGIDKIYASNDINGNKVFKVTYTDGTWELLGNGLTAFLINHGVDYDKWYGSRDGMRRAKPNSQSMKLSRSQSKFPWYNR